MKIGLVMVKINAPAPEDVSEEDRKNRVIPDLSFSVPTAEVFYPDYMYRGGTLFHLEGETYELYTGRFNGMDWVDGKEMR